MDEDLEDQVASYMAWLVEEGGLVLDGMSEDGEPVYQLVPEILEDIAPEFLAAQYSDLEDTLIDLYEKGLVEITFEDDGSPLYSVPDDVKQAIAEGLDLSD